MQHLRRNAVGVLIRSDFCERQGVMKPLAGVRLLKKLLGDERGAILLMTTVYLPVIVGFFSLAVDMAFVLGVRNKLQATADAAALAASTQLPSASAACAMAKTYATTNMPTAQFGNVLKQNTSNCSDVVIGTWTCATGQTCTASNFVSDASSPCGTLCNAVKVTTRTSGANGNTLSLFFAPLIGINTFDVTATAVAIYGGPSSQTWNVMVAQDISQSFTDPSSCPNCLSNAKAAEQALLNCVNQNAASGSKFGVNLLTGSSTTYVPYLNATTSTNLQTLQTDINKIGGCGTSGMPACSGTDFTPALSSATNLLCTNGTCASGPRFAVVFITDGIPNCTSRRLSQSACQSSAVTAINTAAALGIDVYVLHYGTDSAAAAWLSTLPRGHGIYLNAPTPAQMTTAMQQICATMPHRLVY
jgi:Flp pilus assembly protein TadG